MSVLRGRVLTATQLPKNISYLSQRSASTHQNSRATGLLATPIGAVDFIHVLEVCHIGEVHIDLHHLFEA